MAFAPYCVQEDVLAAAGRFTAQQPLGAAEPARIATAISQAQAYVEKRTGTFFYQQHLRVATQSVHDRQKRLFLPAPCISIDNSQIVENGFILAQNSQFLLYQPTDGSGIPLGTGWLEKVQTLGFFGGADPQWWSNLQQAVVVVGQFGYAAVPPDVCKLTAYIAAQLLQMVTQNFVDGAGISRAVLNLKMPDWAEAILRSRTISSLDRQFFNLTVLE